MLDRGAEVNVLLPFDKDDFIRLSVAHGGERWKRRFERAIKLAGEHVTYATREKVLDTHDLFAFADKMLASMAYLRATHMGTLPHLLAVYDGVSPVRVGGTADVVKRWPDPSRLHVIRSLDGAAAPYVQPAPAGPAANAIQGMAVNTQQIPAGTSRKIRTILFADIVEFSRMNEEQTPAFIYKFLQFLSEELRSFPVRPLMENTWGDAIVAVMDQAMPLVEYASTLQRTVKSAARMGLPEKMNIRIGLHAGPVFEGKDPITERLNFFGSHVNRAAHIEPVTLPGRIYASQQFIGLLTSELRPRRRPMALRLRVARHVGSGQELRQDAHLSHPQAPHRRAGRGQRRAVRSSGEMRPGCAGSSKSEARSIHAREARNPKHEARNKFKARTRRNSKEGKHSTKLSPLLEFLTWHLLSRLHVFTFSRFTSSRPCFQRLKRPLAGRHETGGVKREVQSKAIVHHAGDVHLSGGNSGRDEALFVAAVQVGMAAQHGGLKIRGEGTEAAEIMVPVALDVGDAQIGGHAQVLRQRHRTDVGQVLAAEDERPLGLGAAVVLEAGRHWQCS